MIVIPDSAPEDHSRTHPWGKTEYQDDRAGEYLDFKSRPELIRTHLEDFVPFTAEISIQQFFEMIEWVNRPDGLFETNDCAFRGPEEHKDVLFKKALRASGRIQFFIRNLENNVNTDTVKWFWRMFHIYLSLQHRDEEWVIMEASLQKTDFIEIDKIGTRVSVRFSAYGENCSECFDALFNCFSGLFGTFKRLEAAMKTQVPEYP